MFQKHPQISNKISILRAHWITFCLQKKEQSQKPLLVFLF